MKEFIAILIIALIIGGAVLYVIKAKKSGKKCIGCPYKDACKAKKDNCDCNNLDK